MKKIFLILPLVLLASCGANSQQVQDKTQIQDSKQIIENKEELKTNSTTQNETQQALENTKESKQPEQITQEKQIDTKKEEIKEIKAEYTQKLQNLENLWWYDELTKLRTLANANCAWVCNLDMKDKLSQEELKVAEACNKLCVKKQNQAKQKLKEIEEKLKKEKQAYPGKCFEKAKKSYEQQEKIRKQTEQQLPNNFKQPSKEEIIQQDAERCILIYWWTNYDCEKIKKYKKPYEKCKRLRQLQQDIQFIKTWKNKTFDDYLRNWF